MNFVKAIRTISHRRLDTGSNVHDRADDRGEVVTVAAIITESKKKAVKRIRTLPQVNRMMDQTMLLRMTTRRVNAMMMPLHQPPVEEEEEDRLLDVAKTITRRKTISRSSSKGWHQPTTEQLRPCPLRCSPAPPHRHRIAPDEKFSSFINIFK